MVDEQTFKDVMARIPGPVAVITTSVDGAFRGVTVSSFGSLSIDPPLVYACIFKENQSHDLLLNADACAINVLSREQTFAAEQFSGQTPLADPSFSRIPHRIADTGVPLLDGCVSWIEIRPWSQYEGGDHTIFVGQITRLEVGSADDPLIYYDRSFTELAWG